MKLSARLAAQTKQLWLALAATTVVLIVTAGICIAVILTPHLPGAKAVAVPDISASGMPNDPHFSVTTQFEYSMAPAGSVIAQSPAPGTRRKVSRDHPCRVTVTLSRGPRSVTLPPLAGLDSSAASARLRALGLDISIENVAGPAGQVVSTDPAAGATLSTGDCVRLSVGCDLVTVPELRGLSESAARQLLERLGLEVAHSEYEHSSRPAGTVTRQSAAPGTTLPLGACVLMTVSLG